MISWVYVKQIHGDAGCDLNKKNIQFRPFVSFGIRLMDLWKLMCHVGLFGEYLGLIFLNKW